MSHHHPEESRRALSLRLRKIIGQLGAIERMVAEDMDCPEVLNQAVSARRALKSFAEEVIARHMEHCIEECRDARQSQARLRELLKVLRRYVD